MNKHLLPSEISRRKIGVPYEHETTDLSKYLDVAESYTIEDGEVIDNPQNRWKAYPLSLRLGATALVTWPGIIAGVEGISYVSSGNLYVGGALLIAGPIMSAFAHKVIKIVVTSL